MSMTKQDLAWKIGISTAYLSQIESGIRSNPKIEIINSLITSLNLNEEEIYKLYDLYAKATNSIAIDVAQSIKQNEIISKAIRIAEKQGVGKIAWLKFIDQLIK